MNRLRQMSVFAHIVESGSMSAAADALDLSKSVISQHLKALETELGITLLKRTTRRQVLTVEGERFYQSCNKINLLADTAWSEALESIEEPKGRIRITAPNALMETLITPVIGELMQQYPQLMPELIGCDERLDFMEHDIDLAIRVGQSEDSAVIQKRLGEFKDVLCGILTDEQKKNPLEVSYIANSWQGRRIRHEFHCQNTAPFIYEAEARCITNSFHSTLALITSGAGVGIVPDFYLPLINTKLEPVFPKYSLKTTSIYALNPFGKKTPLSVRVCTQAIQEKLSTLVT